MSLLETITPQHIAAPGLPGTNGAIWGTETEDFYASLIRWNFGMGFPKHINKDSDVVMTIIEGSAVMIIDGKKFTVKAGEVIVVLKGSERELMARRDAITYLNVHKRKKKAGMPVRKPKATVAAAG